MFYEKTESSTLVTSFYYEIDAMYIYSWKNIDKFLTYFGDLLSKKFF
jgi:hypothetical protein